MTLVKIMHTYYSLLFIRDSMPYIHNYQQITVSSMNMTHTLHSCTTLHRHAHDQPTAFYLIIMCLGLSMRPSDMRYHAPHHTRAWVVLSTDCISGCVIRRLYLMGLVFARVVVGAVLDEQELANHICCKDAMGVS